MTPDYTATCSGAKLGLLSQSNVATHFAQGDIVFDKSKTTPTQSTSFLIDISKGLACALFLRECRWVAPLLWVVAYPIEKQAEACLKARLSARMQARRFAPRKLLTN